MKKDNNLTKPICLKIIREIEDLMDNPKVKSSEIAFMLSTIFAFFIDSEVRKNKIEEYLHIFVKDILDKLEIINQEDEKEEAYA